MSLLRVVGVVLVGGALACSEGSSGPDGNGDKTGGSGKILAASGGAVTSADGKFAVELAAGMFDRDVTLTIKQGAASTSPAAAATLSGVYDVSVAPAEAQPDALFEATLRFALPASTITTAGADNVGVGTGESVAALDDVLYADWDEAKSELVATTEHFSVFFVVDWNALMACACDTGAECQSGCEYCDADCGGDGGGDGGGTTAPEGWLCGQYYGDGECDCGCGIMDADCTSGGCTEQGCVDAACGYCSTGTELVPCDEMPPQGWVCDGGYSDGECDCGCGVKDVDCAEAVGCTDASCYAAGCSWCWDGTDWVDCGTNPPTR